MKNQDLLNKLLTLDNNITKNVFMKRVGMDFVIKALTPDEMDKITKRATNYNNKKEKVLNEEKFNYLMIAEACVVPNWKEVAESLGLPDGYDAVKDRLLFGEIAYLLNEIAEVNSFDKTDEEVIDEVKN